MEIKPTFQQCDFHTHTELSGEAQAQGFTLAKLFETADALGLRYVGYSEHWHPGTSPDLFLRIRDELDRLQPQFRVRVFLSAEIDVLNARGDLAVDPVRASEVLDYLSVAISHYGNPSVEQLRPDKVEDTLAMIKAVCAIPEVTMLMHPQIVYGRNLSDIDGIVPYDVYDEAMTAVAANDKVVDYPSLDHSMASLRYLGFSAQALADARESFRNFTRAVVAHKVKLAPGSDAHNVDWVLTPLPDGSSQWFGNNRASLALLEACGYHEDQLWTYATR
jgi:histidinol phosphatase-like PHP family hydrolase